MKIVSIFAYASDTVEVSELFTFWPGPVVPSSQTVGFLDAFVLARSSFANSRACKWLIKLSLTIQPDFFSEIDGTRPFN